jgi:hypothetical protein
MFVGYSAHHAHGVYRMLNFETEMIINSHDIIWLDQLHKEWILKKPFKILIKVQRRRAKI